MLSRSCRSLIEDWKPERMTIPELPMQRPHGATFENIRVNQTIVRSQRLSTPHPNFHEDDDICCSSRRVQQINTTDTTSQSIQQGEEHHLIQTTQDKAKVGSDVLRTTQETETQTPGAFRYIGSHREDVSSSSTAQHSPSESHPEWNSMVEDEETTPSADAASIRANETLVIAAELAPEPNAQLEMTAAAAELRSSREELRQLQNNMARPQPIVDAEQVVPVFPGDDFSQARSRKRELWYTVV